MIPTEINIPATDKQRLAWQVWEDTITDDLVYGGSAGGGKTMLAGQVLTGTALRYAGAKLFLGRKELKTLMGTSYITLTQKVFPQYGLKQDIDWRLDGKYNVIHFNNGSRIDLLDLAYAPTDPLYDRFGSSEYTRGWIEEASEVNFKAYDVLKSRVGRWMNTEYKLKSKLGLSLNPSQEWPYRIFYSPWKKNGKIVDIKKPLVSIRIMVEGKLIERTFVFIPALYKDNPFTAGEYSKNLATISDPLLRKRLMDGDWEYSSDEDTLFDVQALTDMFDLIIAYSEEKYLTVDVARYGVDEIVLSYWRGWKLVKVERFTKRSIPDTADKVRTALINEQIPRENVLIDEDGIGGGVVDLIPGVIGFHGGSSPFGVVGEMEVKENYENLKTQCCYYLADMVKDRKVSVTDPDIETREKITQDLTQHKRRDGDKDGKLKITKKEDIKVALGRSPDCGDTMIMRSYFDLRKKEDDLKKAPTGMTISKPKWIGFNRTR
jgi:hypothetical protein